MIDFRSGVRLAPIVLALLAAGCGKEVTTGYQGYVEGEYLYLAAPQAGYLKSLDAARGSRVSAGQAVFAVAADPDAQAPDEVLPEVEDRPARRRGDDVGDGDLLGAPDEGRHARAGGRHVVDHGDGGPARGVEPGLRRGAAGVVDEGAPRVVVLAGVQPTCGDRAGHARPVRVGDDGLGPPVGILDHDLSQ